MAETYVIQADKNKEDETYTQYITFKSSLSLRFCLFDNCII